MVAGAVAGHLKAAKLILLTDVVGVLDKESKLIPSISSQEVDQLLASGAIAGGMIPKVKCCQSALVAGVTKTHIIDGRVEHAVLLEMFTHQGIGTEIVL
jgi:acetylglutamate kinase